MAKGMSLKMLLQLQDKQFKQGLKSIQRQLQGFGNFVKGAFALGSITAFGKKMMQVGSDFENAMARVQSVTNASTKEFQMMQAEAQKMGAETRYSATEAANALENLTRNGLTATEATKALSNVLQLAQANAIELSQAADILTNTMKMFGLSVDDTTRINDVLSSTAANAATNVAELYEALVNAAPAANTLGISLEETSAALGALANVGTKGANAGTAIRTALTKMVDGNIIKKMQQMGVAVNETTIKAEGLTGTLKKLKDANLGLTDLVTIFSQRGAVGIQQLINAYDDFQYTLNIVSNSAGTTARMFEQGIGSTKKNLEELKSAYEGLLITISQKTGGAINGAINIIKDLLNNFKSVGGTIANLASVVVPLFTNSILKLGRTIKTATASLAAMKASLGGIVTIVATLVTWIGTALFTAWNKVNGAMREANKQAVQSEAEMLRTRNAANLLIKQLGPDTSVSTLAGVITQLCKLFPEFADEIRKAGEEASRTSNWDKLKNTLSDIVELQHMVVRGEVATTKRDAAISGLGGQLAAKTSKFRNPQTNSMFDALDSYLKKIGYSSKEEKESFYSGIANIIVTAGDDFGKSVDDLRLYLDSFFPDINFDALKFAEQLSELGYQSGYGKTGRDAQHDLDSTKALALKDKFNIVVTAFENEMNSLTAHFNEEKVGLSQSQLKELEETYNNQLEDIVYKYWEKLNDLNNDFASYNVDIQTREGYYRNKGKADNEKTYQHYPQREDVSNQMKGIIEGIANNYNIDEIIKKRLFNLSQDVEETFDDSKLTKALEKYSEDKEALSNRLKEGTLTQEEYDEELQDITNDTWEVITALSKFREELKGLPQSMQDTASEIEGNYKKKVKEVAADDTLSKQQEGLGKYALPKKGKRDTQFDYIKSQLEIDREDLNLLKDYRSTLLGLIDDLGKGMGAGDFDLIKGDATKQLAILIEEYNKILKESNNAEHKLILAEQIDNLNNSIKSMGETSWDTFTKMADGMDRMNSGFKSLKKTLEGDATAFEKMLAFLNLFIQTFDTMQGIIQSVAAVNDAFAKQAVLNSAMEVAASRTATTAKMAEASATASAAVASGTAAGAKTGYPALLFAIPTALAAVYAGLKSMGKFANGGIIGGSSYSGDNLIANVNSGEMILNKKQQSTLFDIANGKLSGTGGEVVFKIRGSELEGVLKNYNKVKRG